MYPDISKDTVGNTICKCGKLNCLTSVLVLRGQFLPEVYISTILCIGFIIVHVWMV